ncbi:MAG: nuclear transport factor 2 family protein [Elusimicrobia bacterium]|nr:nuclear transport factor 2 family protein [Elusimicrobiota bacterium]
MEFFTGYYSKHPDAFVEIKRMIADGDLVAVHVFSRRNQADRGNAVVDIFRLEKGKIVEHWDVAQSIPEKSANDNTMF